MKALAERTLSLMAIALLVACSGGGGGGGGNGNNGGGTGITPVTPSVSGDMLALASSRGWNYQGNGLTVSTYYNPQPVNGVTAFSGAAVVGSITTVLTSASNVYSNFIGALGIIVTGGGDEAVSEISAGSTGAVPGSPIITPNTLTQGQVFSPSPGVTATVTFVGTVPGSSGCPVPTTGATVQYVFQGQTRTMSFVPGCGITQFIFPSGATYTLVSVGSYPGIGQLSTARRVETLSLIDTAKSLLGLESNSFVGLQYNQDRVNHEYGQFEADWQGSDGNIANGVSYNAIAARNARLGGTPVWKELEAWANSRSGNIESLTANEKIAYYRIVALEAGNSNAELGVALLHDGVWTLVNGQKIPVTEAQTLAKILPH